MKASQSYIDELINAALAFGLGIPSSVNEQLTDNGYERVNPIELLERANDILSQRKQFDSLIRGASAQ